MGPAFTVCPLLLLTALPGSPIELNVDAGVTCAATSTVSGASGAEIGSTTALTAGDSLDLLLKFRDRYENETLPPERAGSHKRNAPAAKLAIASKAGATTTSKAGASASKPAASTLGAWMSICADVEGGASKTTDEHYIGEKLISGNAQDSLELSYELQVAGAHTAHFLLGGEPLSGSPVQFVVEPGAAFGPLCTMDHATTSLVSEPLELTLTTRDRHSNRITRGGADVGVTPEPATCDVTTTDRGDGTYSLRFLASVTGEYTIVVRLDGVMIKDMPLVVNVQASAAASASVP